MSDTPTSMKWWARVLLWLLAIVSLLIILSLMNDAPPWAWGMLLAIWWMVRRERMALFAALNNPSPKPPHPPQKAEVEE